MLQSKKELLPELKSKCGIDIPLERSVNFTFIITFFSSRDVSFLSKEGILPFVGEFLPFVGPFFCTLSYFQPVVGLFNPNLSTFSFFSF